MDLDRRFNKVFIGILAIIISAYLGNVLVRAINAGMEKTIILLILLPMALAAPYFASRIRLQTWITVSLLFFWLPTPFILSYFLSVFSHLFLFESVIWVFLLFMFLSYLMSKDARFLFRLKGFPLKPFLLYIAGAVIAYFLSYKTGIELSSIRIICVFPMLLSLTIFLTMVSIDDAKRYLWAVLISAFLLGLLFLFGPRTFSLVSASDYAAGSGRASLYFEIPYLGSLTMNPASTGDNFAFMFTLAFGFMLFGRSFGARIASVPICLIFGAVMIYAQGRAGILASSVSVVFIALFSVKTEKKLQLKPIFILGIMILFLIGGTWYLAVRSDVYSFAERILILRSDPLSDPNLISRMDNWRIGLEKILQSPLGVGLSGYEGDVFANTWAVHNLWLFLPLSFGIIGFAGFVLIMLTFLRAFWKGAQSTNLDVRRLCVVGIGLMINLVIAGVSSPVMWEPYTVGIVWVPLATIYAAAVLGQRMPA